MSREINVKNLLKDEEVITLKKRYKRVKSE